MLTIKPDKTSALVNEAVTIVCTVAGKRIYFLCSPPFRSFSHLSPYFSLISNASGNPRPANAAISWTHSGGYDISSNYTTVATGPYDLTSTLALTHLVTELSGVFRCKVGSSQMSTGHLSIARKLDTI